MTHTELFTRLLDYLLAESDDSLTNELLPLSDMEPELFNQFLPIWNKRTQVERRNLLAIMGRLTDARIELQFNRIYEAALDDPDPEIRRRAINNLWESEDPKLIPNYLDALSNDPSTEVRIAASDALGRYILLGQFSKIPPDTLITIEDVLLSLVADERHPSLQRACIEALGYSSRPGVEAIIQTAYLSLDEDMRYSSLVAMGRSANQQWVEYILDELISHSPKLRAVAARATGELEIKLGVNGLLELLDDVNDEVRINAIWSMGQIGGTRAREALEALQTGGIDEDHLAQIEEALEHIAFLEGTPDFLLYNFDDDEDELS